MDKSSEHSEGMGDDASGDESDSSDESTEHDDILISKLRAAAETGRNALLDVARNTVAQKDDAHSIFNCAANTICSDLLGAGVITAIQAQIKEKMGGSSLSERQGLWIEHLDNVAKGNRFIYHTVEKDIGTLHRFCWGLCHELTAAKCILDSIKKLQSAELLRWRYYEHCKAACAAFAASHGALLRVAAS